MCGEVLRLANERIPWHKRPGSKSVCQKSGIPAGGYDAVTAADVQAATLRAIRKLLVCPSCSDKEKLRNGVGSTIVCGACGTTGEVAEFLEKKAGVRVGDRQHRYGG